MPRPFVSNSVWNQLTDLWKNDYISHYITDEVSDSQIRTMADDVIAVLPDLDELRVEFYPLNVSDVIWDSSTDIEKAALFSSWLDNELVLRNIKLVILYLVDKYTIGNNIINTIRRDYF